MRFVRALAVLLLLLTPALAETVVVTEETPYGVTTVVVDVPVGFGYKIKKLIEKVQLFVYRITSKDKYEQKLAEIAEKRMREIKALDIYCYVQHRMPPEKCESIKMKLEAEIRKIVSKAHQMRYQYRQRILEKWQNYQHYKSRFWVDENQNGVPDIVEGIIPEAAWQHIPQPKNVTVPVEQVQQLAQCFRSCCTEAYANMFVECCKREPVHECVRKYCLSCGCDVQCITSCLQSMGISITP